MALIITRNEFESIVIDDRIVVTVYHGRGKQIKVEVNAPGDVAIYRQELITDDNDS